MSILLKNTVMGDHHQPRKHEPLISVEIQLADSRAEGKSFRFIVNDNRVSVKEWQDGRWGSSRDWMNQLSDQEKADVFNMILADRREQSNGSDGWRVASLGVTKRGQIYISETVPHTSSAYHKQCAEPGVIRNAVERINDQRRKRAVKNGEEPEYVNKGEPKFQAIYVMAGSEHTAIGCSCGLCTDLLSQHMVPTAPLTFFAANDGSVSQRLNTSAFNLNELKEGEAWQTTMGHLNRDRFVTLDRAEANRQKAAYETLIEEVLERLKNPQMAGQREDQLGASKMRIASQAMHEGLETQFQMEPEMNQRLYDYIALTTTNQMLGIWQLACKKAEKEGVPPPELTADYIREQLRAHHINNRAAAVFLEDGRGFVECIPESDLNSSADHVEIAALNPLRKWQHQHHVAHVVTMGLCPEYIDANLLETSPKAAIERLSKFNNGRGDGIDFHYVQFNAGGKEVKDHALEALTKHFEQQEIYMGGWNGNFAGQHQPHRHVSEGKGK